MKQVSSVFWISIVIAVIFVIWGAFLPQLLTDVMSDTQAFFMKNFGWFYQMSATFFLVFALFLIFSKYGRIKLGKDEDQPEFNRPTWFAMLFSAGMGIGLLFFGVSEPISHFSSPPFGEGGTSQAATTALQYTYLHWGFHAWSIYAVVALTLAYYKFRKGLPGLISATLYPILGEKTNGPIGKLIDIVAVIATLFGVAASLGLGAAQINGGLNYLTGIPNNFLIQFIIVAVVTVMFLISAATGIKRGIKYLSNANMGLAFILFVFFLFVAPTVFVLDLFTTTFGGYIQNLAALGLRLAPFNEKNAAWLQSWTIFYWAWWIAWAPFVGTFIARVSRGRTVREFITAVLIIPTLVCAFWFAVFGGTGIYMEYNLGLNVSGQALEAALFYVFQQLPFTIVLVVVTLLLILTFFITSADSATFVLGMQTTYGSINPPNIVKIVLGLLLSASAVVLMATGGLQGFQSAIIISAFPLGIVLLFSCYALLKDFRAEMRGLKQTKSKKPPVILRGKLQQRKMRKNKS
ncbi:glycine betaine uptake BCCT transporter [Pseudalkalibacillus salsuginis]|uniref:glycine betaine uptake BCCT transporter n=1 Tax=Pseudalkalibacillus salsuginis TaxID=2910972 RepID=UPI001F3DB66E|nr:BCCT family transporter [Pseudalkalibacillus salsuginis]MCF6410802.1 BCCT family transporter [Pseudalkalibacillus salsuginis]